MNQTPESIKHLLLELQGPDEFGRAQASFALGMLGEPAVDPLIALLSHADREVRMRAAWALGVIGQPALQALLELAESGDEQLRIEAIRILGVIGEGRSLNQLFQALTDPSPHIAQRAAIALGKIGDPRAFHPLLTATRHPSSDVRYAACSALAHLQVRDAVPILQELVRSDTSVTSWGAPVGEAARRAAQEIAAGRPRRGDGEFARVSELLRRQHAEP
jgi:HEAT repeat protein